MRTEISKQTSRDFSHHFDFLTKDFGLRMISEIYSATGDKYIRVLQNQYVPVELTGGQESFHTEIRRLINGEPQPYPDHTNNISVEDLATVMEGKNYIYSNYYPSVVSWTKVLENTAALFNKSSEIFTTNKWIATGKSENSRH